MENHHQLLNISYQRAISPDPELFFKYYYDKFFNADPQIAALFSNTDMERRTKILMESMTHIISFVATNESNEEINRIAISHGKDNLNIPTKFYDVWLECLIDTVREHDPEFNSQVETAWRVIMSPGLEYMKSFCRV
jgi:hemoglobin-like flavoprotein